MTKVSSRQQSGVSAPQTMTFDIPRTAARNSPFLGVLFCTFFAVCLFVVCFVHFCAVCERNAILFCGLFCCILLLL